MEGVAPRYTLELVPKWVKKGHVINCDFHQVMPSFCCAYATVEKPLIDIE